MSHTDGFEKDRANDIGAPFEVVIVRSPSTGNDMGTTMPDIPGLLRTVVMARVGHPRALSGRDIAYLRNATGFEAGRLARAIALDETALEAYESGARPIPGAVDKLVRIHAMHEIRHDVPGGFDRMLALMDWIFDEYRHVPLHLVGERVSFQVEHGDDGWTILDAAGPEEDVRR